MRRLLVLVLLVTLPAMTFAHPAPDGFADLAERLSPAVVNISAVQHLDVSDGLPQFPQGSPLERYNDVFGTAPQIANSLGAGFIINSSGIVVTNNHVIDGADAVEVSLPDGRVFPAIILGIDPITDLAVLQMETDEVMPFVEFGDSDVSRVGDWVIAIGNPYGLGGSLAAGVVSGRGRDAGGRYDDYIQTDVAINTGNSGGPLFNMSGQVIGVNTLILSPTGASVGISLSIPSNIVQRVVAQLEEFGETRRGWLGVSVQHVTAELAESFELESVYGAIISRIEADGPAASSDLRQGDLVLTFDGRRVRNSQIFPRMVAETDIDRDVNMEIIRRDRRMTVQVTVGELAEEGDAIEQSTLDEITPTLQDTGAVYGMTLADLTPALRRRYRVSPDVEGVLVTGIDGLSDAAGKIRIGDVIEEIEFAAVKSIEEIRALIEASSGGPLRFQYIRGGQYLMETIRP